MKQDEVIANGQESAPSSEEAKSWLEDHLPRWRVFFAGEPYLMVGDRRWYWLEPATVDSECPLMLVPQTRDGFDLGTGEWIRLSARALRDKGMAYFTETVVDKYSLSILDLAVIQSLLSQGLESIPVVPVSMPRDEDAEADTCTLYDMGPRPAFLAIGGLITTCWPWQRQGRPAPRPSPPGVDSPSPATNSSSLGRSPPAAEATAASAPVAEPRPSWVLLPRRAQRVEPRRRPDRRVPRMERSETESGGP